MRFGGAGVAALVLFAVLGVSTTSCGYSMLDFVRDASGGIDFERTVKTLAPGYDFNLDLDPGCTATDMYGCSAAISDVARFCTIGSGTGRRMGMRWKAPRR